MYNWLFVIKNKNYQIMYMYIIAKAVTGTDFTNRLTANK